MPEPRERLARIVKRVRIITIVLLILLAIIIVPNLAVMCFARVGVIHREAIAVFSVLIVIGLSMLVIPGIFARLVERILQRIHRR